MILASLTIRDFKQFAGEHTFEPERQGITAVIGPNGAGKTTLFEAIEWCLYGSRSVSNTDVLPRGVGGSPMVRVVLEENRTGQRFAVERRLTRSKVMQADVWDEANPEQMLATGSKQVVKYVSEKLIGRGHAAFIATFFTRQKELSFFGSMGVTDRRRKVGQMIGVETVRIAQAAIGEERTLANASAIALGALAEQESDGRDFASEIAEAEGASADAAELVARRSAESTASRAALTAVGEHAERIRVRAEQDQSLAHEIAGLEADRRGLTSKIEGLDRDLERLSRSAAQRESLLPIAARTGELRAEVARWAQEQQRAHSIAERQRTVQDLANERSSVTSAVRSLVQQSATPHLSAWSWSDERDLGQQIMNLLEISAALDLEGDRTRLSLLDSIANRRNELVRASGQLATWTNGLEQLRASESKLLEDEDPATEIERVQVTIDRGRAELTRNESERKQAITQGKSLEPLVASLRARAFDDRCPTCGRRIDESEADGVVATLVAQIENWNDVARRRERDIQDNQTEIRRLETSFASAQKRSKDLVELRGRIANGELMTVEKANEVDRLRAELESVDSGENVPATPEEIERLRSRVAELAKVVSAAQGLAQRYSQLQELDKREIGERSALAELGEANYNADEHRAASAAFDEANRAVATIEAIDRDLSHRDAITATRAECEQALAANAVAVQEKSEARSSLAYDPGESADARERVESANAADRNATSQLHFAQTAQREAQSNVTRLQNEQRRHQEQLDRSAALRREADQLGVMYAEFGLFDQYVAAHIAPRLAEQTSELLDIATDGKYTSVDFDENYGIHVYDGATEKFPLENFSGGERDVVALCARLALSQMIGNSGAHPPSFLVFDEVFGALDRDRRMQLLELLGRISESIDAFQQMFIISHVDDVRTSPIFSRVIRVSEAANGASVIEDATELPGQED